MYSQLLYLSDWPNRASSVASGHRWNSIGTFYCCCRFCCCCLENIATAIKILTDYLISPATIMSSYNLKGFYCFIMYIVVIFTVFFYFISNDHLLKIARKLIFNATGSVYIFVEFKNFLELQLDMITLRFCEANNRFSLFVVFILPQQIHFPQSECSCRKVLFKVFVFYFLPTFALHI